MEMNNVLASSETLFINVRKPFYDKGKPLETVGRKAIGPFERMAAELPRKGLVYEGDNLTG